MHFVSTALLLALALSSASAESLEACTTSTDIDGTCAATAAAPVKARVLEGYLQQLAVLRAEAEEMATAPCTAGSEPHFSVVDGVQDRCPEGFEITSSTECREAIQALGLEVQMIKYASEGITAPNVYAWSVPTFPVGCSHSRKTRLHFGVFNSDEAGTGDERVSLICRTSAGPLQPEAPTSSSEWSGGYERLREGEGCLADSEITSAAECAAAIGSLELESHDVIKDEQSYRPSGCSYYKDGRPGFPKRGLFNTWKDGRADAQFDPICRKVQSVAEVTTAVPAYEEEADIDDDLEAEARDFSRLSMGTAGFVGGLSKS